MQCDALKVFLHISQYTGMNPLPLYFLFCKVCRTKTNDLLYSEIPLLRQQTRILFNVTLQLNIKKYEPLLTGTINW